MSKKVKRRMKAPKLSSVIEQVNESSFSHELAEKQIEKKSHTSTEEQELINRFGGKKLGDELPKNSLTAPILIVDDNSLNMTAIQFMLQ
mmetsp:Transcript_29831/g.37009  ORF Transcript_29831/g.37009 Transcript_29831/m.37009 type:complete len:89 (-) Transcript_29831:16-282(-)